ESELRQCFAALLWCSTHPDNLKKSITSPPGSRAMGPRKERRFRDYIMLRCSGLSVDNIRSSVIDGPGILRRVDRVYDHKEVSIRSVIDIALPELTEAFAPVFIAF